MSDAWGHDPNSSKEASASSQIALCLCILAVVGFIALWVLYGSSFQDARWSYQIEDNKFDKNYSGSICIGGNSCSPTNEGAK